RDARAWLESRPPQAETIAIERLAYAAREAEARVHVVHASSHDALRLDRVKGFADVTLETCPHYLTFDAADVDRLGPPLKCAPPIREGERELLWRDVLAPPHGGTRVEFVASDHSPCTASLKT